jgi:hypothetical protein
VAEQGTGFEPDFVASYKLFTGFPVRMNFLAGGGKQCICDHKKTALLSGFFDVAFENFRSVRGLRHKIRTYEDKMKRAAALVYTHFKREFHLS